MRPFPSPGRALRCATLLALVGCLLPLGACSRGAPTDGQTALGRIAQQVAERPAPPRAALLVGVGAFAAGSDSAFAPLPGTANDVQRVAGLLIERFGFEPADVSVLLDGEATHERVLRAFELALLSRARAGAELLFYFSGHGSRAPVPKGSGDADGLGATLICHDSRAEGRAGQRDLFDFQLASLVKALEERGASATVVLDACHSGGALRGVGPRVRAGPQGVAALDLAWNRSVWPSGVILEVGRDTWRRSSAVQIAACRPQELAFEFDVDYGERRVPHGALTWFLGQELGRAGPDTSWALLVAGAAAGVATHFPAQRVSFAGDLDRPPFGAQPAPPIGFAARRFSERTAHVEAGWLQGLRPGSILELRDRSGKHVVSRAIVERATTVSAIARSESPLPADAPLLRAVELARPPGTAHLRVWAAAGLETLLVGQPLIEPSAGEPDLLLTRGLAGPAWLETFEGLPICEPFDPGAEDAPDRLAAALSREARWRAAFALGLESGPHSPEVRLRVPRAIELATLGGNRVLTPATLFEPQLGREARTRVARSGADPLGVLFFDVRNVAPTPLFLSVLSVSEDRALEPILPLPGQLPVRLAPGESIAVPVGLELARSWPLERALRDRFVFLVTERELFLESSRAGAVLRSGAPAPPLLDALFAPPPTRGAPPTADRTPVPLAERGYDVAWFDLLLSD